MHSYIYPEHENVVKLIAKEIGFNQISLSSEIMPMVKIIPRSYTAVSDAYLTPCLHEYIRSFQEGFCGNVSQMNILFMQSDGGLCPVEQFIGSRAILSGPAGGVMAYAMNFTEYSPDGAPLVGFDMGGTSTDVSRYGGTLEHVFETSIAGVQIQAPQLDISTVAAGGGSCLFFHRGIFHVGPESVGSNPGPVCYGREGTQLAITDANLLLGRVLPEYFPKIFGPNQNEPLFVSDVHRIFEQLTRDINAWNMEYNRSANILTKEQVALGFIEVANETMCRPIRSLTQAKGFDTSNHILMCFGGAGGQHACAIARSLGIKKVIIHKYSSILSAYGIALSDVVQEVQAPLHMEYIKKNFDQFHQVILNLEDSATTKLCSYGFNEKDIVFEVYLHLRYRGTDCALMCRGKKQEKQCSQDDFEFETCYGDFSASFIEKYKKEMGFVLEKRTIMVDDIRVRAIGRSPYFAKESSDAMFFDELKNSSGLQPEPVTITKTFFSKSFCDTPVYQLSQLHSNGMDPITGPAILLDQNSTILVEPGCTANLSANGNIVIDIEEDKLRSKRIEESKVDAIKLSIFSNRFMSIAEQMGKVLRRTSISTNIKERLDFSCALFDQRGGLVANAPHIPVHLGAMQRTVEYQMSVSGGKFKPGDVYLSNHPSCGGSHLPDLTVITPVFYGDSEQPVFFLANRGHHADIGGLTPGSMPPFSQSIDEEGAVFKAFLIVKQGVFQEQAVIAAFKAPGNFKGCSGTRALGDNLSDLRAQIASNQHGIALIHDLIGEYGLKTVQAYMEYICENAEHAVRDMLRNFSSRRPTENEVNTGSPAPTTAQTPKLSTTEMKLKMQRHTGSLEKHTFCDQMDDGSEINLLVTIDKSSGSAIFDFTGSSPQVIGNINAPQAIVTSALIYSLRLLVGGDIPLNQGCLKPVKIILPPRSILSPSEEAAVVGGNVMTSQRIVDVILGAFQASAASQGCMNNLTFGNSTVGYYETICGGAGAGFGWHGQDAIHTHMTNTRITDPEILERRYPVHLMEFSVRKGSGGAGKWKGGDGVVRCLRFRQPMNVCILSQRRVIPPYGLYGGHPGKRGCNLLFRKGKNYGISLGGFVNINLEPGDSVQIETPGGGGYGKPLP